MLRTNSRIQRFPSIGSRGRVDQALDEVLHVMLPHPYLDLLPQAGRAGAHPLDGDGGDGDYLAGRFDAHSQRGGGRGGRSTSRPEKGVVVAIRIRDSARGRRASGGRTADEGRSGEGFRRGDGGRREGCRYGDGGGGKLHGGAEIRMAG